jgi:outer membrane protein OmpA-like peptidoglycan-associated protein
LPPLSAWALDAVDAAVRTPAGRLDAGTSSRMSSFFGFDFSTVRIHTGPAAEEASSALDAGAFTVGNDVVFGRGRYHPGTARGDRLIAHELVHVLRNRTAGRSEGRAARAPREVDSEDSPAEREADRVAQAFASTAAPRETDARSTGSRSTMAPNSPREVASPTIASPVVHRQGPAADEASMTRAEEIAQSRASPGEVTGLVNPLSISLYNYVIDGDRPKAEHLVALGELARLLNGFASVPLRVHALGHADSTGPTEYNDGLSKRRAQNVRAALARLTSRPVGMTWAGELSPFTTNDTVSGRSRNRRVDLRFFVVGTPTPQPQPSPIPEPPGRGPGPPRLPPKRQASDPDRGLGPPLRCHAR